MTHKQTEIQEIVYKLSDSYYETIIGKRDNSNLIKELVGQLKHEGYTFERHQGNGVSRLYNKLQTVVGQKVQAVDDKWYERADTLRHKELRLVGEMEELAYFSTMDDKTILFLCARMEDEWIVK